MGLFDKYKKDKEKEEKKKIEYDKEKMEEFKKAFSGKSRWEKLKKKLKKSK